MTTSACTFLPWDVSYRATLSNGNLTCTCNQNGGVNQKCSKVVTGLNYWETTVTGTTITGARVGITTWGVSHDGVFGSNASDLAYDAAGGVYCNNTLVTTLASWVTGSVICVAIDPLKRSIWFRVNNGYWNNSSTANPATNVGGLSLDASPQSCYAPIPAVGGATYAVFTIAMVSGSWTYTAPTGFSALTSVTPNALGEKLATGERARTSTMQSPNQRPIAIKGAKVFTSGNPVSPLGAGVTISGTLKENSSNVARTVYIYDQKTGQLLEKTKSNASTGAWSALAHSRNEVFAVAFDPTSYQALVYDQITPA